MAGLGMGQNLGGGTGGVTGLFWWVWLILGHKNVSL